MMRKNKLNQKNW